MIGTKGPEAGWVSLSTSENTLCKGPPFVGRPAIQFQNMGTAVAVALRQTPPPPADHLHLRQYGAQKVWRIFSDCNSDLQRTTDHLRYMVWDLPDPLSHSILTDPPCPPARPSPPRTDLDPQACVQGGGGGGGVAMGEFCRENFAVKKRL